MVKLQIALDGDLLSAQTILSQVHPFIDIVEIGTPLIYQEGMRAVRQIRETYPDLTLLADLKKAKPSVAKGVYLQKVTVSSTMGPGLVLDHTSLDV